MKTFIKTAISHCTHPSRGVCTGHARGRSRAPAWKSLRWTHKLIRELEETNALRGAFIGVRGIIPAKGREHPELRAAQNTFPLLDGNHPLIAGLNFLMVVSICLGFFANIPY